MARNVIELAVRRYERQPSSQLLQALALEALVDAAVQFHVTAGVLVGPKVPPTVRQQYRERCARMLNDLQLHAESTK